MQTCQKLAPKVFEKVESTGADINRHANIMHLKVGRSYDSVFLSLVFPRPGVSDAIASKEQKDFLGSISINYMSI